MRTTGTEDRLHGVNVPYPTIVTSVYYLGPFDSTMERYSNKTTDESTLFHGVSNPQILLVN